MLSTYGGSAGLPAHLRDQGELCVGGSIIHEPTFELEDFGTSAVLLHVDAPRSIFNRQRDLFLLCLDVIDLLMKTVKLRFRLLSLRMEGVKLGTAAAIRRYSIIQSDTNEPLLRDRRLEFIQVILIAVLQFRNVGLLLFELLHKLVVLLLESGNHVLSLADDSLQ